MRQAVLLLVKGWVETDRAWSSPKVRMRCSVGAKNEEAKKLKRMMV